ncbi:MAG: proton-conducting transporter membrane subunit [Pseudomonadota bacterium]|nr:proton-conducting transporter membrane subunit [Pseudomonadota bacterium]MDP1906404.1 proton-conducting transporter membrane subunit [Pseudomonadota bacterium]MDP2351461.1 proton-conducting transporter membrane subunit [Pseudomonadota bacterium]
MTAFSLAALVPALPLLAALLIALLHLAGPARGEAGETLTARITLAASGLSLLTLFGLDALALITGAPGQVRLGDWFASGAFRLPLSFTLDGLSLGFATLVGLIALVTLKFSVNYMHREAGFHRFFIGMNLFAAGMLLIVLAGNAGLAFVGWELAGVSSWMLIGYAYERGTATINAQRAFLTNRIGDAGFLLGIALAFLWLGSLDWAEMAHGSKNLPTLYVGLMAIGFVTAALAKSAQLPFSPWIARALEGPTPSSAIFYGAVMVHAGVYLVIRLQPVLIQTPGLMAIIACIGLCTALYGWIVGYVQSDVKSALLFATLTQVGLMFLACGLGLFQLAAWHMALHATWRAWQFLAAPSYMHLLRGATPPAPAWLRRFPRLYTAALQRFWLEPLADRLLTRPTLAMARDMRAIDDNVISSMLGMPEARRADALLDERELAVVKGRGLAGGLLMWVAIRFDRFEQRLVLQGGGGRLGAGLRHLGDWLKWVEYLLEQPRYLLLMVMATLVAIL